MTRKELAKMELVEIREILKRTGWDPAGAERLQADGIGPEEAAQRAAIRDTGVSSLFHTHHIGRADTWNEVIPWFRLSPEQVLVAKASLKETKGLPEALRRLAEKVAKLCGRSVEVVDPEGKLVARVRVPK